MCVFCFMHIMCRFCRYLICYFTPSRVFVPCQLSSVSELQLLSSFVFFHIKLQLHSHTHNHLTALFLGLPGWAGTRKVKPIWILLKQETLSGSGISWAICKSTPRSKQTTTPAPHHSVFYRTDALPATQPTASKH